jgi:tetratricopeptide (TPR) repeat protein
MFFSQVFAALTLKIIHFPFVICLMILKEIENMERFFTNGEELANNWRIGGRWNDALCLLNGMLPVATELGPYALSKLWLLVAKIQTDCSMFSGFDTLNERQNALELAIKNAEIVGDFSLLADVWAAKGFSIHIAYLDSDRKEEPDEEFDLFERALQQRRTTGQTHAIAESLFFVGLFLGVVRRDHKMALPYFEEALRLSESIDDKIIASYAVRHMAFALHASGDLKGARRNFEKSLQLREQTGFVPGVAMAWAALSSLDEELGDIVKSIEDLENAKVIFESLGATKRLKQVTDELDRLKLKNIL